jgi:hypothetical protein
VLDLIERACDAGDRNEGAVMTLHVQAQVSLKPFNTFGIDVRAQLFAEAHSDDDVREALAYAAAAHCRCW